jgi:transposase-like protein
MRVVDAIRLMCAATVRSMEEASKLRGPCKAGHPVTLENTQRIGDAGYRCKECRRKISRESARKMRREDNERICTNARRANATYRAKLKARGAR